MTTQKYDASSIQVLEGLEAVRKRPGMYIGTTDKVGLHHLVKEIVDNSVDEAMAGYCDRIEVTFHLDGSCSVSDNGRGIPVDTQAQTGKTAVETIMTVLHAGGKFGGGAYKNSAGLHGVGASVVNALSTWTEVIVRPDPKAQGKKHEGKEYRQAYDRGVVRGPLRQSKATISGHGTTVRFLPDNSIFPKVDFEFDIEANRLRQYAYLNKGIWFKLYDERTDQEKNFFFEGGIKSYVKHLCLGKDRIHPEPIYVDTIVNDVSVELALQYTDDYSEVCYTFANAVNTHDGGSHLTGFRTALTQVINQFAKNVKANISNFTGDDVREGLVAVISVKLFEPQFEGQTKTRLGNPEVTAIVQRVVSECLTKRFEEDPQTLKSIVQKSLVSQQAREASRKAREIVQRKNVFESGTLPGKLADCTSRNIDISELFIVEGDSAGGSAKGGRDRLFQAILPLRGKIMNVEKASIDHILGHEAVQLIVGALGTGIRAAYDQSKLRYGKVIIMTDADVDGAHIRTLLLTFFFRNMPELINNGNLYIAQPPLYRAAYGKNVQYAWSNSQLQALTQKRSNMHIQRFKGLGEMNAEQLWDTTMNPDSRLLLQVTVNDANDADKVFRDLMGNSVVARRQFIQQNAKNVANIDL